MPTTLEVLGLDCFTVAVRHAATKHCFAEDLSFYALSRKVVTKLRAFYFLLYTFVSHATK